MSELLLQFFLDHLLVHIIVVFISTIAIIIAMAIDLIFGIRKAYQRGKATTSRGLKMTAKKAVRYLVPYSILVLIDFVCAVLIPVPVVSIPWVVYVLLCEWKSIRESAWRKEEISRQNRTVRAIIVGRDNPEALADVVLEESSS